MPSIKKKSKFSKECRVDLSAKIPLGRHWETRMPPFVKLELPSRCVSFLLRPLFPTAPRYFSVSPHISYLVLSLYLALLFLSFFTLPTCHQIITVSRPPPAASRVLDLDSRTRTAITRVSARDLYPSIENRPRSCMFAHREDDSSASRRLPENRDEGRTLSSRRRAGNR